ncbi:hypothetical protein EJ05DRAFT_474901 [Pseudovirgaria hyperparasitica]|uniref:Ras-associating domain-containing protein n=1 Tax=Pseudovirgaria hyperparasitica TaxID=470096 RepID=A0A6A6WDB3_9PEZI|nr:uncharacterized protein EJ05DRAFT_474901 [Pseudovirgaria hyperparasitica]KAF2759846.1 hypothetical protein EJ05DRAFT_474901 [Pseudovirgaria hyperparasitica]
MSPISQTTSSDLPSNPTDDEPPASCKHLGVPRSASYETVLRACLAKYGIEKDPDNYVLFIIYGDKEHQATADERPLVTFEDLESKGYRPSFMLRQHNERKLSTDKHMDG